MDFPDIMRPAYAVAECVDTPDAFAITPCVDLLGIAAEVQRLRAGRPMETGTTLLTGSTDQDRRRALAVTIRDQGGGVAHELRLLFQGETFETVRQAIRLAGRPRAA